MSILCTKAPIPNVPPRAGFQQQTLDNGSVDIDAEFLPFIFSSVSCLIFMQIYFLVYFDYDERKETTVLLQNAKGQIIIWYQCSR